MGACDKIETETVPYIEQNTTEHDKRAVYAPRPVPVSGRQSNPPKQCKYKVKPTCSSHNFTQNLTQEFVDQFDIYNVTTLQNNSRIVLYINQYSRYKSIYLMNCIQNATVLDCLPNEDQLMILCMNQSYVTIKKDCPVDINALIIALSVVFGTLGIVFTFWIILYWYMDRSEHKKVLNEERQMNQFTSQAS
jgi:hypothetical protein